MLSSFNVFTNYKVRKPVKNLIEKFHFVESKEFESTKDYFNNLVDYMFVLCPEGNGADTHRIWESLLLNVIPVVVKTPFSENLKRNSVPCLYLDRWEDLEKFSETDLIDIYENLTKKNISQFSYFEYWIKKINV